MSNSSFNILKDFMCCLHMSSAWFIQKLVEIINCIGKIGTTDGEVKKFANKTLI